MDSRTLERILSKINKGLAKKGEIPKEDLAFLLPEEIQREIPISNPPKKIEEKVIYREPVSSESYEYNFSIGKFIIEYNFRGLTPIVSFLSNDGKYFPVTFSKESYKEYVKFISDLMHERTIMEQSTPFFGKKPNPFEVRINLSDNVRVRDEYNLTLVFQETEGEIPHLDD